MTMRRCVSVAVAGLLAMAAVASPPSAPAAPAAELAARAREILKARCFECHGQNPRKISGDLKVLDNGQLLEPERGLVVPKAPDDSLLIKQVEEEAMPPGRRPKLPEAERKALRDWVVAGAPPLPNAPVDPGSSIPRPTTPTATAVVGLPARAKEVFRVHCLGCHGGGGKVNGGVKILDRDLLLRKAKVVPGSAEDSLLFQLLTATDESAMPPGGQPRLGGEEIEVVRAWIVEGAKPFPADVDAPAGAGVDPALAKLVGVDYVLKAILKDVRALKVDDRPFARYFSVNHLLTGGATRDELDLQREALAKAINHLSREAAVVRPEPIEPSATVFRVDLRALGWDTRPFEVVRDGKAAGKGRPDLFDLALLEYPYGVTFESSETFDALADEFLRPAGQVRPVPYVRADWFVSTATQPPLYEDFLRLPPSLKDLEARLGVDSQADLDHGKALRAGMAVSGVSRNNRVVERHPAAHGAYWKSYDFRSSKGDENIFKDPADLHPAGGEMIFNLPNGLQGYILANGAGGRLDAAPTEIVTDKFSEDKTVRNGLACMRCHDAGMKDFADAVRPAVEASPGSPGFDRRLVLRLYPAQAEMDILLKSDTRRFGDAMAKVLGKPQAREPLIPVTRRFLDSPLPLSAAGAELGLADPTELRQAFRSREFTSLGLAPLISGGAVRRDMWEDYFDRVVRHLGLGVPLLPLDALARPDFRPDPSGIDVALGTNGKNNVFAPGDELVLTVKNPTKGELFVELIGTGGEGRKVILTPTTTRIKPGGVFRFPSEGAIKVRGGLGKERVTVFACDAPFPAGELLRGVDVADRVVHPFYRDAKARARAFDPSRLVKKTIEIETR